MLVLAIAVLQSGQASCRLSTPASRPLSSLFVPTVHPAADDGAQGVEEVEVAMSKLRASHKAVAGLGLRVFRMGGKAMVTEKERSSHATP
jgi:hypothetical protein